MDMRNVEELVVEEAIIHILNKEDLEPTLIDFTLDLTADVDNLFKKHIKNSIIDENTRIAKFNDGINIVKEYCKSIFDLPKDNFVPRSKEIAKHMFNAMKQNGKASSANFAVCLYSVGNEKSLALLKLDFSKLIQTRIERTSDGKKKIKVVVTSDGIPNTKQKLQKCVFIKEQDEENDFDLILLDKQASKDKKDELVANYFAFAFLNCKLKKTDRDNTRYFKALTQRFIDENFPHDIEKSDDVRTHLFSSLRNSEEINVLNFANEVFGQSEELREKYVSFISEKLGDFSFNIDKSWVKDNIKRKKIKTNTNIEINIDLDTSNDDEKFLIKKHDDEDKYDIIIKNVSSYSEIVTK
jgi:hypothetical protein